MNATATASTASRAEFILRPATVDDVPLIRDSWKRSYKGGGRAPKCEPLVYWEGQAELIDALLKRSHVVVAVSPEDSTQVFGWAAFEKRGRVGILHYCFVKAAFRRYGVARALLQEVSALPGLMHSHRTEDGDRLTRALRSTWNPYLLGGIA